MTQIISSSISNDNYSAIIEYVDDSNVKRIISIPCCERDQKTSGKTWRDTLPSDLGDTVLAEEFKKLSVNFTDAIKTKYKLENDHLLHVNDPIGQYLKAEPPLSVEEIHAALQGLLN